LRQRERSLMERTSSATSSGRRPRAERPSSSAMRWSSRERHSRLHGSPAPALAGASAQPNASTKAAASNQHRVGQDRVGQGRVGQDRAGRAIDRPPSTETP
jgi:hypothetical protein